MRKKNHKEGKIKQKSDAWNRGNKKQNKCKTIKERVKDHVNRLKEITEGKTEEGGGATHGGRGEGGGWGDLPGTK